jgi:DivIVA domain-containing protein
LKIFFFKYFRNRKGQESIAPSSENVSEFPKTFLKMKITPLEIRQHEFEKTFRGYNIEEVDNFLVNLSQEWERVLNESKMLRMQLEIAEKEANKLREIEMTLFKTLKTAEDTSTMITEQANQQADKHIQESKLQGEKLLMDAQQKANGIVRQAEERARYIKEEVLGDVKVLERDFRAMDHYKTNLLVQMRSLSTATLEHVQRFEDKFDKEGVDAKFKEATSMLTDEEEAKGNVAAAVAPIEEIKIEEVTEISEPVADVEEEIVADIPSLTPESIVEEPVVAEILPVEEMIEEVAAELPVIEEEPIIEKIETLTEETVVTTTILSSSVNNYVEPQPVIEEEVVRKSDTPKADELEIIEGIGPKIAMLLYDSGIFTFRDLAITPVYKIQEILEQAGPQFARHDPSTWTQQAKLAAEGRWNDLDALKFYLVGGREPKKDEVEEIAEPIVEPIAEVQAPVSIVEEIVTVPEPIIVEEPVAVAPVIEEIEEKVPSFTQAPIIPVENNLDSITEEMLEKVNKVKAAIRKAMVEKNNDAPVKDNTPLPTLNDIIAKNESSTGGSFFDNL